MSEIETLDSLVDWCRTARHKIGAVDGYDYRSGEEAGLADAQGEIEKRLKALRAVAPSAGKAALEEDVAIAIYNSSTEKRVRKISWEDSELWLKAQSRDFARAAMAAIGSAAPIAWPQDPPVTGDAYLAGRWSRRNYDAMIEDFEEAGITRSAASTVEPVAHPVEMTSQQIAQALDDYRRWTVLEPETHDLLNAAAQRLRAAPTTSPEPDAVRKALLHAQSLLILLSKPSVRNGSPDAEIKRCLERIEEALSIPRNDRGEVQS